eukprot:424199-Pyramimonas_sp.AAC.1
MTTRFFLKHGPECGFVPVVALSKLKFLGLGSNTSSNNSHIVMYWALDKYPDFVPKSPPPKKSHQVRIILNTYGLSFKALRFANASSVYISRLACCE